MSGTQWTIKAREFVNCNCSYGCPCQFNALPTYGFCQAVAVIQIDEGFHGETKLDGLRFAGLFRWPGPIHMGNGEACVIVDERADEAQRRALLRIVTGEDTEPGATIFQIFSTTFAKVHDPVVAAIDFEVDVDARRGRLKISGVTDGHGEPIRNPVTGAEHRARINLPNGFEYTIAEIGRGWTKTERPPQFELNDSYAQFAAIHLSQSGVVR
jgi:hypothetical protein